MSEFTELKTKKARIAYIRERLATNRQWATRGLVRIYEHQTSDEQTSMETKHHNGVGFTGADAEILTSIAKQVLAGRQLSEKQFNKVVFKKMPKYARQLESISK